MLWRAAEDNCATTSCAKKSCNAHNVPSAPRNWPSPRLPSKGSSSKTTASTACPCRLSWSVENDPWKASQETILTRCTRTSNAVVSTPVVGSDVLWYGLLIPDTRPFASYVVVVVVPALPLGSLLIIADVARASPSRIVWSWRQLTQVTEGVVSAIPVYLSTCVWLELGYCHNTQPFTGEIVSVGRLRGS